MRGVCDKTIDAENNLLLPVFIDLHCHGGNGYEFMDGDVLAVSKTMSSTPARVMNLTDRGVIAPNYRADLLNLNNNYDIVKVVASGEEVSVPCGKT